MRIDQSGEIIHQAVIRQVRRDDLLALEWEGEYTHFRRLYTEAYRRAESGGSILWVAEIPGNGLVGQLFVHLDSQHRDLANGETRAYIYGFRMRPAYRSKGIGSQMLVVAEKDLAQRGFRWIVLNVGRENVQARRLYERHGYAVVGTDPGHWTYVDDKGDIREVIEPAYRMEKMLRVKAF
jgi:ribosomal protein S18 acetylase RimI-like enzyme